MTHHRRLLGTALLFILVLTGLSLWLVHSNAPPGATGRVESGGTLRVGFAVEVPYAFIDARGRVTGEAPEIFRRVAQELGVQRLDWERMEFANLLPALRLGRVDVIASGMFITPEREQIALFSRPTARVRPAAIVRQGEERLPANPQLADVKRADTLRWVTVHGAVENDLLREAGVSADRILTVPQVNRGMRALAEGRADALAISAVTASQMVASHLRWPLEMREFENAPTGLPAFAFRRQDRALRDAVDQVLKSFLGSEEHIALVRGFGFTEDELPID